ncbi:MAG: purine-nucleoside phosphorylase [Nitrospinota bacterium]|nr:purine-nucleoside phosphorylase [Nitrospinota bacterium]
MDDLQQNEKEDKPEASDISRAESPAQAESARKTRAAKRAIARPATLRRKRSAIAPAAPQEAAPGAEASTGEEETSTPEPKPRSQWDDKEDRSQRGRGRGRGKKPQERATRPQAKGSFRKTDAWDEEKFEIKSLPDGTQLKVKRNTEPAPARRPPRRRGDDSGPGPAVVDLDEYFSPFKAGERKINLGTLTAQNRRAVTYLKRHLDVRPKVAVILGSGLHPVAELATGEPVPYSKIPGFMETQAKGHPGQARSGEVEGVPTIFMEGRLHYYETMSMKEVVRPVRTLLALGVEYIILTTAAGGLNPSFRAGDVMFITDHINLMGDNPFFGENPNSDPSPFVDVSEVYDQKMISQSERICRRIRIRRREGVLAAMRGPVYETPAERAWLHSLGADAVCMSLAPEALAAAAAGVPVTGLALIANDAASMKSRVLTHEAVAQAGLTYAEEMKRLVKAILGAR